MQTLQIDKEFKELCPKLQVEERSKLESSIEVEGCTDPIDIWNGIIVDGHNRYEICLMLKKPYEVREREFVDRNAAINWIIAKQLGRRNLTDEQKSNLRAKRYCAEKKPAGGQVGNNGGKRPDQNEQAGNNGTRRRLAKELGVSEATIQRDCQFSAALDEIATKYGDEARQQILSGQSGWTKAEIISGKYKPEGKPKTLKSELRKQRAREKQMSGANDHACGAVSQQDSDEISTKKQKQLRRLHEAIKKIAATVDWIVSEQAAWHSAVESEHWTAYTKTTIRNKLSAVEAGLKQVHKILK